MKNVLQYQSLKDALSNLVLSRGGELRQKTRYNYQMALTQYLEFVNSQEDLTREYTPDDLLEEAKEDRKKAQVRIVNFFQWLQGNEVPGYRPWIKDGKPHKVRYSSARQRAYSTVRGFYTNNEVMFPKTFRVPPGREPETLEADTSVPFFRIDKENNTFYFDRSLMKHFLANLKLRDQAITLSLVSTSQDTGDLFALTVGWARMQENRERFYWHGNRTKTGVPFKVFFSQEATEYVRRYIRQEREGAKNHEPIFMTSGNEGHGQGRVQKPMKPRHIGDIFREVAKKMGIHDGGEYQNPLRPKRLRHIFRTACTHVHMDEGYMHSFMGHKSNISQRYLEKPVPVLEIEYSKVEPMLTVFEVSESKNLSEIRRELNEWKGKYADLSVKMGTLKEELNDMRDRTEIGEERFNRFMEILARAKNVNEAVEKFSRLGEENARSET